MSTISPLIHLILPLFISINMFVFCYSLKFLHLSISLVMLEGGGDSEMVFLVMR